MWVGNLSLDVKENILRCLFYKFGPIKSIVILKDASGKSKQCGFVNFLSQEVAECAALKMDGCEVLGQVMKTKGPRELLATGKSTAFVPVAEFTEKRDYRGLTDCVFYMERGQCCPKSGECPFRHCLAASQTDVVCDRWIMKQCTNYFCPRRHPRLLKQHQDTVNKEIPSRCPSHNAFKCTGECGLDDCNTHFMEQDHLQEHIKKGRERKFSLTSSCSQCKAIFFSDQEKQQHTCLNASKESSACGALFSVPIDVHHSPNLNAKTSGPLMFTSASPQNLVKPQFCNQNLSATSSCHHVPFTSGPCNCSGNHIDSTGRGRSGSFCICSSCGKAYENSGDSLSDFDLSIDPVGISGHKCPNSPSVRGLVSDIEAMGIKASVTGSPSQSSTAPEPEPIGVFWDIENCPVPRGKSAAAVVQKIRKEFFNGKREVEFMCVCDISKEKKEVIEELNKAQVTVVHINATSKNAADDKLRQSLRRFGQSYPAPATVILVSGDVNFAAELSDLRHRNNLEVICLHNAQAQPALLACAQEARRFDHFTADLPVVFPPKTPDESCLSSELLVLNLPVGKDVGQVKNRLKKLSDNCGGKVVSISGGTSLLRFPNPGSAARARRRMDKEDVFGSTIQVIFSTTGQTSPQKGKKIQPGANINTSPPKARESLAKQTFNPLLKERESSNALLDDFIIDNGSMSTKGLKTERQSGEKPRDNSPESSDSTEENEIKQSPSLSGSSGPQFITQQTMFSNGSYAGVWPHPIYQNFMNLPTQNSGFPGITPLGPPLMGGPQLAASWLASVHNFTVLDQQRGGIDLLVTNLDETVNNKELKKKLASVFREHCKVLSVILHSGEGIPLRAFVKVPKLSDAHLAICKVHGKKIFNTQVTVNIATDKEKELCFLRCEVTSILKEAPLLFLPLNKFLSDYYEKCSRAFDMSCIGLIHDLVVVTGKPGNQAISLVTRAISAVKVSVDAEQFARDVHELLQSCEGAMPLVSIAASYWLKFDRKIEVREGGVVFADALSSVPNVKISDSLMVSWAQPAIRHGGNVTKLLSLSKDLKELLLAQDEFRLPLSSVISEYQLWFGRKTLFDPIVYGFSSVVTLLEALPAIVEVTGQGSERWLSLSKPLKVKAFEKNLKMLLEAQPDGAIALGTFVANYMKYFGHKCKIATFGFSKLTDLIEAVSGVAKIQGTGEHRLICLVEKVKSPKSAKRNEKQTLVKELKELLSRADGQKIPLATVLAHYYQHFGRLLKFGDYGAGRFEDLVADLPSLQITEISGEKFLTVAPKVNMQSLRKDVVDLLQAQDGKFLLVSRLSGSFRACYGRKFPLGTTRLEELIKSLEGTVTAKGSGIDRIIILNLAPAKDKIPAGLQPLADKITKLLMKFPASRVAQFAFSDIYLSEYGQVLKPKEWGFGNIDALMRALGNILEVQGTGNMAAVCIKQEHLVKVFSRGVVDLLLRQADKSIRLSKLVSAYEKLHNHKLRAQIFGFVSLDELLSAISAVAKVDSKDGKLRLTPLQSFAIETRDLLRHLHGCVSLNRFAPNFQQLYGRPCKAADYGFNRISEVIDIISNVAQVRGKCAEKMVILVDGDDFVVPLNQVAETQRHQEGTVQETRSSSNKNDAAKNADAVSQLCVEEDDEIVVTIDDNDGEDLIVLDGEGSFRSFPEQTMTEDWLMAPVPESLPEPDLQPAVPEPPPVGDLISFTEFDVDLLFAAINNMGLPNPLSTASPGGDLTELLAESNELSGEYNGSPQRDCRVHVFDQRSPAEGELKDLEMPRSPTVRPSPMKPGVMFLSEVEADLLSRSPTEPTVSRKLAAKFTCEAAQKSSSHREEKKGKARRFSAPKVKLAASFSKTPSN